MGLVLAVVGPLQSIFLGLLPFLYMGFGLVLKSTTTAFVFMGLGLVLIGIATFKANILRWRALPLLTGILGIAVWYVYKATMQSGAGAPWFWSVSVQALMTLFGASWVLLGYTLWSDTEASASQD
ncbi:MAG: hypothetical protein M3151_04555 [Actinomycetota bacterium]|nr:hypothetical protein [Actinomycetota bacterium]